MSRKVLYPVTSRTYFSLKSNHEYSEDFVFVFLEICSYLCTHFLYSLYLSPFLFIFSLTYVESACRFFLFFIIDHLCPSDYFVSNETTVTCAVAPDTWGKNVTLLNNKACRWEQDIMCEVSDAGDSERNELKKGNVV